MNLTKSLSVMVLRSSRDSILSRLRVTITSLPEYSILSQSISYDPVAGVVFVPLAPLSVEVSDPVDAAPVSAASAAKMVVADAEKSITRTSRNVNSLIVVFPIVVPKPFYYYTNS